MLHGHVLIATCRSHMTRAVMGTWPAAWMLPETNRSWCMGCGPYGNGWCIGGELGEWVRRLAAVGCVACVYGWEGLVSGRRLGPGSFVRVWVRVTQASVQCLSQVQGQQDSHI